MKRFKVAMGVRGRGKTFYRKGDPPQRRKGGVLYQVAGTHTGGRGKKTQKDSYFLGMDADSQTNRKKGSSRGGNWVRPYTIAKSRI